jgi:hypothetical protein
VRFFPGPNDLARLIQELVNDAHQFGGFDSFLEQSQRACLPAPFRVNTLIGQSELKVMCLHPGSLKSAPSENLTAVL